MKVFKKTAVAVMVLLACTFGFAQEADNGSSGVKGMYAGMQMGGGNFSGASAISGESMGFFEMTPYFGMYLSDALPDLALEFALQMGFMSKSVMGYTMKYHIVSPQVLAAYTFDIGKVNPFIKAGVSLNFSGGSYIGEKMEGKGNLSIVLNPGVSYKINDNAVLSFYTRFNLNDYQEIKNSPTGMTVPFATRSLGVGFDYHF